MAIGFQNIYRNVPNKYNEVLNKLRECEDQINRLSFEGYKTGVLNEELKKSLKDEKERIISDTKIYVNNLHDESIELIDQWTAFNAESYDDKTVQMLNAGVINDAKEFEELSKLFQDNFMMLKLINKKAKEKNIMFNRQGIPLADKNQLLSQISNLTNGLLGALDSQFGIAMVSDRNYIKDAVAHFDGLINEVEAEEVVEEEGVL